MIGVVMALALAASSVEVAGADTVQFGGRLYRLYDIDAPQAGQAARCRREAARAEETAGLVRTLLAGARNVRIVPGFDPRGRRSWPNDRAGRRLAHIEIDGSDLGEILIRQGRAVRWDNRRNHDWCHARG